MKCLAVLIVIVLSCSILNAQSSIVTSPADSSTGVSRSLSTITVDVSHIIDFSSVIQNQRAYGYDTTEFEYYIDSLDIDYADSLQGIYVLLTSAYDSSSGDADIYRRLSLKGYTTIVDDTTLTFTIASDQLRYCTASAEIGHASRIIKQC